MPITIQSIGRATRKNERISIESGSILGLPSIFVSGAETRHAVHLRELFISAFRAQSLKLPRKKLQFILHPEPSDFDLANWAVPLALQILIDQRETKTPVNCWSIGGLSLQGELLSCSHTPQLIAQSLREPGRALVLPRADETIARMTFRALKPTQTPLLYFASNLRDLQAWAYGNLSPVEWDQWIQLGDQSTEILSLPNVTLHRTLAQSLRLSLGAHLSLFLFGARGQGKSFPLEWIEALLEKPRPEVRAELLIRGLSDQTPLVRIPTQARPQDLIGKNADGLLHQAHRGVLVADEWAEWSKSALETLREPLERGKISSSHSQGSFEEPARFLFIATSNECRCGGVRRERTRSGESGCVCGSVEVLRYQKRIPSPILDRIPLLIPFRDDGKRETSLSSLRDQIESDRSHALCHWGQAPGKMNALELEERWEPKFRSELRKNAWPSLRRKHQAIRIAFALAAQDQCPQPTDHHFEKAVQLQELRSEWIGGA